MVAVPIGSAMPALMTVLPQRRPLGHEQRRVRPAGVTSYRKGSPTPEMHCIDYGLWLMDRDDSSGGRRGRRRRPRRRVRAAQRPQGALAGCEVGRAVLRDRLAAGARRARGAPRPRRARGLLGPNHDFHGSFGILPGSGHPSKRWDEQRFREERATSINTGSAPAPAVAEDDVQLLLPEHDTIDPVAVDRHPRAQRASHHRRTSSTGARTGSPGRGRRRRDPHRRQLRPTTPPTRARARGAGAQDPEARPGSCATSTRSRSSAGST